MFGLEWLSVYLLILSVITILSVIGYLSRNTTIFQGVTLPVNSCYFVYSKINNSYSILNIHIQSTTMIWDIDAAIVFLLICERVFRKYCSHYCQEAEIGISMSKKRNKNIFCLLRIVLLDFRCHTNVAVFTYILIKCLQWTMHFGGNILLILIQIVCGPPHIKYALHAPMTCTL